MMLLSSSSFFVKLLLASFSFFAIAYLFFPDERTIRTTTYQSRRPFIQRNTSDPFDLAITFSSNRTEIIDDIINRIKILAPTRVDPKHVTRILLVATFRSGSSFVGDLLQQSHRQSFYFFEPLYSLVWDVRIDQTLMPIAAHLIRALFECNYEVIPQYNNFIKTKEFDFGNNAFVKKLCGQSGKNLTRCTDPELSREICLRSHVQIMKTTRLGLEHVLKLDLPPGTKVVYLQRDSRAIYSSRKEHGWCRVKACRNISVLCKEQEDDLKILENWPNDSITVVRYEDLALNPLNESKRLFKQLRLDFSERVELFVKSHTNANESSKINNNFSTYRNSSAPVLKWKKKLRKEEITAIQESCNYTLKHAGYELV